MRNANAIGRSFDQWKAGIETAVDNSSFGVLKDERMSYSPWVGASECVGLLLAEILAHQYRIALR